MAGLKYKVAHKRADKTTWSASERARRKRLVQILREVIAEIERGEPAIAQPQHSTLEKTPPRVASRRRTKTPQRRRPQARPVRRRAAAPRRTHGGR